MQSSREGEVVVGGCTLGSVLRRFFLWAWCTIGIIWLALEGLLAFLSLAFVGLIAFAFVLLRFLELRSFARRGA